MSKEEMTQFSLIIKEAIKESNKSLTEEIVSIKDEFKIMNTRLTNLEKDMVEVKADIKAMENTPKMKKRIGTLINLINYLKTNLNYKVSF